MEGQGQRERTSSRRRQRRKAKNPRSKVVVEPVLIVARRPDSPLLKNGFHTAVASAHPKQSGTGRTAGNPTAHGLTMTSSPIVASSPISQNDINGHNGHAATNGANGHSSALSNELSANDSAPAGSPSKKNGHAPNGASASEREVMVQEEFLFASPEATPAPPEARGSDSPRGEGVRRRAVRIVKATDAALSPGNREQQLLDRLVRSEGRGAISRAANDLWESKFVAPKRQEVQIQLLEHENEHRARDAVFAMAELLQREAPIKRPVLDQRLRRLEQSAEDPITRDAAGALRRSMRVHHGA